MAEGVERLCVVGGGHIGSSILRGARKRGLARELRVADRSEEVRGRLRELGLADEASADPARAAAGADLVILCVPVGAMGAVAADLAPGLKPGAIVSDVGSVKAAVAAAVAPYIPAHAHFVPAHPVAGLEHSGPDSGVADLFVNRWCILTPLETTDDAAAATVAAFWRGLGAQVETMTPAHHDLVLAITSHVPHLIAYNIVGTASDLETVTAREVIKFSAGGFRDFTRIASSDPTMWRDIFLNNKEAVLEMLGRFTEDLTALQRAIRWGDGDALFSLFTRTRAIRRQVIEAGQAAPEPVAGASDDAASR
ncbi:MAG: prephenate/arogenate dehydrogenase family protein [Hyphomicrobiales bacterium]|nr:prephenate/arogenate dehydrogenase family protein [Hyphomicrobiales bacterium]